MSTTTTAMTAPGPPRLLILGMGPVGRAVAQEAVASSWEVYGTVRQRPPHDPETFNENNHHQVEAQVHLIPFSPETLAPLVPLCTHVLITIPPPFLDDPPDPVREAVVQQLCQYLPRSTWLGFVSTTGVYGNYDNAWVTEDSPLLCGWNDSVMRYVAREEFWRNQAQQYGWTYRVFRCAGLYGPQRSALHTVWKKGWDDRGLGDPTKLTGVTNRIHEFDVARALVASMKKTANVIAADDDTMEEHQYRVYNLSDDEPETRTVVLRHAVHLLKSIGVSVPLPQVTTTPVSLSRRSKRRQKDHKRISNQRMKMDLLKDDSLLFPTYREGLTAIFEDRSNPWWAKIEEGDGISQTVL